MKRADLRLQKDRSSQSCLNNISSLASPCAMDASTSYSDSCSTSDNALAGFSSPVGNFASVTATVSHPKTSRPRYPVRCAIVGLSKANVEINEAHRPTSKQFLNSTVIMESILISKKPCCGSGNWEGSSFSTLATSA